MPTTPILDYAGSIPVSTSVKITRFDIDNRITLAGVPTLLLGNGTVFEIITGSGSSRVAAELELQTGAANVGDASQIQPADDPTRHWQVVDGFLP